MTTTRCAVQDCTDSPAELFAVVAGEKSGISLQWPVCTFHSRALSAGEAYSISDDRETILLGAGTPLKALNFIVNEDGLTAPQVTLVLGHDGIESRKVTFEVRPDMLRDLCAWVTGSEHAEAKAS